MPCVGVDHQDRHLGALDLALGQHHRQLLRRARGLAAPPDAGGVDEQIVLPFALDQGVDRVARRAGNGRDEDPLVARRPG